MGVLDAFMSTWSTARETFGQGLPPNGAQYDRSGPLRGLQVDVRSAAPGSAWSGSAASAYKVANTLHGSVFGRLAELDSRLGTRVAQSSHVVSAGRRHLDDVRRWVLDAAASVPQGKDRERMLMPIVQTGLSQVSEIVAKSNGDLSTIGGQIRTIGNEYQALLNQKFAPKEGGGKAIDGWGGGDTKTPGDQAAEDFEAVSAGTATPEQISRIRAASTLTPEQLGALKGGKPTTMDQGQYDYLHGLMRSQDGMSAVDVHDSVAKYPELRGAMGDSYQIMGNPNVQTGAGARGGMTKAPNGIQALLNDGLRYETQGGGQVPLIPLHQFDALNHMLGDGAPELRAGSDVGRALLNESSRISDLVDKGHAVYSDTTELRGGKGGIPFGIADPHDVNRTLTSMLQNASGDHQAVTDFLTGANDPNSAGAHRIVDATHNHFTGDDGFHDLVVHHFDDGQSGARPIFDWMGKNAYAPGLVGFDAAASANATAHLIANNQQTFTLMPDGHGSYHTLGQQNPELVRTFTTNLSPFIGNLDGVQTQGIAADAIPGFTDTKQMGHLFKVLDTDPASSRALNNVVAQWERHFAYEFGHTRESELGRHAGQLTQAMQEGNRAALEAFKTNDDWDAIRAYQSSSEHFDTTKQILLDIAGLAPGGNWAVQLGDLVAPRIKEDILGVQGDPGALEHNETAWQTALKATDENFKHLIDGRIHEFDMLQGYLDSPGADPDSLRDVHTYYGTDAFVDEHGSLDWDKITGRTRDFNGVLDSPELGYLENWNDGNHGYESGLHDTNIDPRALPDPRGSHGRAPR